MMDPQALSSVLMPLLDEAGVDLQRALELAGAEILRLQLAAGRGINRGADRRLDSSDVPRLMWIRQTLKAEDNTRGLATPK